jgi:hypothetical protein
VLEGNKKAVSPVSEGKKEAMPPIRASNVPKIIYGKDMDAKMDIVSIKLLNRKEEDNGSSWLGEGKVNVGSFPKEDVLMKEEGNGNI